MNKVILMGRLTADPEIKYSQGENPLCIARYSLAVDRRFKKNGDQQADFPRCVAFGKSGEFAERYLHKGMKIAVVGRITTGSYTNKDGQKIYTTEVTVEEHYFAESKAASRQEKGAGYSRSIDGNGEGEQRARGARPSYREQSFSVDKDGFMSIPDEVNDEELPFNR